MARWTLTPELRFDAVFEVRSQHRNAPSGVLSLGQRPDGARIPSHPSQRLSRKPAVICGRG